MTTTPRSANRPPGSSSAWVPPTLSTAPLSSPERVGRSFYRLHVDLIPGHPAAAVAQQLELLGVPVLEEVHLRGRKGYDVHFLVVDALPGDLEHIAWIEGVRMIQEAGDGLALNDLSGGGKLQNRSLSVDDKAASPIVTAADFPLWVVHNLQGQGQFIGVVDTALDFNNTGTNGCAFGFPNANIDNWGFALPNLARVLIPTVTGDGVNLKIPRVDLLGGASLQGAVDPPPGEPEREHGCGVAGAALGDFFGNDDTRWFEHDIDDWEAWSPFNFSGLLGPGIAHEAQLYFTPVDDDGSFAWSSFGEFENLMGNTLENMAESGVSATVHSTGIVEAKNEYTQVSVVHDVAAFDFPQMLQCMAAGNCGEGAQPPFCGNMQNQLTSQASVKNALTVGASDDVLLPENRAPFSSTGPRFDGAIKPDIMAPGTDLGLRAFNMPSFLLLPNNDGPGDGDCVYQFTNGTSFAAPIGAGAAALIHQYFEEGRYPGSVPETDPSAALMKAMLINGAQRLTGQNLGDGTYPNGHQGWGEPKLTDVLELPGGSRSLIVGDVDESAGLTGQNDMPDTYTFEVTGSSEPLRASLVWTDEPGSTGTSDGRVLVPNACQAPSPLRRRSTRSTQPSGSTRWRSPPPSRLSQ